MMASYHPPTELLAAYAAGTLKNSYALCVATHLEYCSECRAAVQRLNIVGAELMEDLAPTEVSESIKSAVFDRLDQIEAGQSSSPSSSASPIGSAFVSDVGNASVQATTAPSEPAGNVPKSLSYFNISDFSSLTWKKATKAISSSRLFCDVNDARVELLRIMPGGSLGKHTHIGEEVTVILQGSFSDEDGGYCRGDFMIRDESHQHMTVATNDAECICLTVQDGPIQFTGWFMRLLNPFLRIIWVRSAEPAY